MRYEDEILTIGDGACYKIARTWTIIDWVSSIQINTSSNADIIVDDRLRAWPVDSAKDRSCVIRSIKDNGDGYVRGVQIIKVTDKIAPVITRQDTTYCITDDVLQNVTIPFRGKDNCSDQILYR